MNLLTKLILYFKKPPIIVVVGKDRQSTTEAILLVFEKHFKIKKFQKNPSFSNILRSDILIYCNQSEEPFDNELLFYIKKSKLPILIVTDDETQTPIIKSLNSSSYLVLNFNNQITREIKETATFRIITFGMTPKANFWASDIKSNHGINFKINYKRNIIPFWLDTFDEKKILSALVATSIGVIFNINLVEISEALKEYK